VDVSRIVRAAIEEAAQTSGERIPFCITICITKIGHAVRRRSTSCNPVHEINHLGGRCHPVQSNALYSKNLKPPGIFPHVGSTPTLGTNVFVRNSPTKMILVRDRFYRRRVAGLPSYRVNLLGCARSMPNLLTYASFDRDDRAVKEYITTQSRELKKRRGLRNIYYLIVSSGFSDDYETTRFAL
jgi:hypothetical protein